MSIATRLPRSLRANEGKIIRARGDLFLIKVTSEQTDGHYSMFEARNAAGGGVPPHRHRNDEEACYVLQGRYRFRLGDETLELGPGDVVHIPRPTIHAFQALEPSRMLTVVSPGGFHERYFEDGWEVVDSVDNLPPPGEPDFARVGRALEAAGIEMIRE